MLKFSYTLQGLNCAGCAATIEQELSSIESITGITVDFIDKELTFYLKNPINAVPVRDEVIRIIKKIEPNVKLIISEDRVKGNRFRDSIVSSLYSWETLTIITGILVVLTGMFVKNDTWEPILFICGYLLIGWQILYGALSRLFSRYLFNEHLLMTIATIGALTIGEYIEAIAVMLFYQVGKFLENKMVDYSQKSINELLAISPEYANLETEGKVIRTEPGRIKTGEIIVVKPGERVPLDCTVIEGSSEIDKSFITGESLPASVNKGSKILSGSINLHSVFRAKVDKVFEDSTISRIIEIIKRAKNKKTNTERFINKFAKVYTPIVISLAFLIAMVPPLLLPDTSFTVWLYRALIFLVISCPCALVISVPLSFFAGLAVLVKRGILIKGAIHIESLAGTKTVFLDKTGTITTGRVKVANVIPVTGFNEADVLRYAYLAESHSNHPLALAVNAKYHQLQCKHASINSHHQQTFPQTDNVREIAGKGLIASTSEGRIVAGSIPFLKEYGIDVTYDGQERYAVMAVALNNSYIGLIEFSDTVRSSIKDMIAKLRKKKIDVIMLTGDKQDVADDIATATGVNKYYAELKPEEKMNIVNDSKKNNSAKGKTVFIGDGINDAPAMSTADIGIAMGGIGSAVSIEAADVVLQTDEIDKLADVINISEKTLKKAKQNIAFALGIKALFLLLGAGGMVTIWGAVFADVGVTVLAVLNSLQLLKYRNNI